MLRTLNIACNTYGSSITHRSAGVAGSDLGTSWITAAKVGEMCHRAPRPPLTFTFQRGATDGGAGARHSPGARGPQRRRADTPRALPRTTRARACDCARITVLKCSQPWIQLKCAAVKVETGSPISVVQRARNSRAASHSPAGSVSQAWKWRKHR